MASKGLSHRSLVCNYQDSIRKNVKLDQVVRQLVKRKAIQKHVGKAITKGNDWDLFIAVLRDTTETVFLAFLETLESTAGNVEAHRKLLQLLGGEGGLGQYNIKLPASPAAATVARVAEKAKLIRQDCKIGESKETLCESDGTVIQSGSHVDILSPQTLQIRSISDVSETKGQSPGIYVDTVTQLSMANEVSSYSLNSEGGIHSAPLQQQEKPLYNELVSECVSETELLQPAVQQSPRGGLTDYENVPKPPISPPIATRSVKPPLFVGPTESEIFTHRGGVFYSPVHGITVSIPEKAIPSHVSTFKLEVGVCLHGPFVFPLDNLEICSPVVSLSCEPSFQFVSDVNVEIPHCAIIESESDYDDLFVLRAPDSECSPYWNFHEVLESELSDYYVMVKVQHFSKVTLVSQSRKGKGKVKIRKKQSKAKRLKGQHSLDSSIKYVKQSSLDSSTSDPGSSSARKRTYSSPASSSGSGHGSNDDMLSTSLNEFTVVCCTPQNRSFPSWMVAFVISYSHPTGWMLWSSPDALVQCKDVEPKKTWQVAKQAAQNVLGCTQLSCDQVLFTFDEEVIQFDPAVWEQDGWMVEATKSLQIPRSLVVRYKELPEEKQYSLVEFCPHLMYSVEGTNSFRPLKCRITVRGANSYGGRVFFTLKSPVPSGTRSSEMHPVRQEASLNAASTSTHCTQSMGLAQGSILNVQNLSLALVDVINWHTLGIRLGVPVNMLKNIEQSYPISNERCKHEMLSTWLQITPFASWRDVAKALHEMEYHHAANTVHRVHESVKVMISSDLLPDDSDLKVTLCGKNLTEDVPLDLTKLDHQNFLAEVSLQLLSCKCLSEELGLQQCTITVEQDFESVYQMLRCWVQQRVSESTLFVLSHALKNLGTTLDLCTYLDEVVTDDHIPSEALYVQAEFLCTISQKIASQWKFVGRFLGLAEHIIQDISSQEKDDAKQAYHMLLIWKQQNHKNATCYAVANAVRIINQHAAKPFSLNDALCYTCKYIRDIQTHESTQGELMSGNDT